MIVPAMRHSHAGLVIVIVLLGTALAVFGGSKRVYDRQTRQWRQVNRFLDPNNLLLVGKEASFFAIMAVGATFVIVSGGIDLSVGSVYCLAAVTAAMFLSHFGPGWDGSRPYPPWSVPVGILICLAVGTACGALNGVMIVNLRVHPFIITLGTMGIFRGIALVVTKGNPYGNFPPELTENLIRLQIKGLSVIPTMVMLAVTAAGAVLLHRMVLGRYIYAIGGNEEASRFSGLPVGRVKFLVYTLAGLTAGIAAVIMLGYYGAAASNVGDGYELEVIAAAVVGGASLTGGRGSAIGALLGAVIIRMISNGIVILDVDENYSKIIIGAAVILAVVLDQINARLQARRMSRSAGPREPALAAAAGSNHPQGA